MRVIVAILAFLIGGLLVFGFVYTLKQPSTTHRKEVCLPKRFSYIGSGCGVLFMILTLVCVFANEPLILAFFFLCFTAICGLLVLMYINRRIYYNDESFVVKNIFGKTDKYHFSEITGKVNNVSSVAIYVGEQKISIETTSVGLYKFLDAASKGYERHHDEKIPPHERRNDLFNGNIKGSTQIFWGYVAIYAVLLVFFIFSLWVTYSKSNETNTDLVEAVFSSCESVDDKMNFYSSDGEKFQLRYIDSTVDKEALAALCDGETKLAVYAKMFNAKNEDDYYVIDAIKVGDDFVVSFELTNRLDKNVNQSMIVFSVMFIILWSMFVIFSIIVGRNPDNFSRRIVYFFFRKDLVDR